MPPKETPSKKEETIYWDLYNAISIPNKNVYLILSQSPHLTEQESFNIWKNEADRGVIEAQFRVGLYYEMGIGVSKSYKNAFCYYKLAADQGHSQSQFSLAVLYEFGHGVKQDYKEALHYYQLAAAQGDGRAIAQPGALLYRR
ncbi:tetratricopeptide repeat protein [Candidatus Protochlamydia phocaeensis]|uniref:tetratricopeptide repeat protein n=1 Tax=Candidatus Protochlamydia phocaeensis TaxID=1414722 RepID=UPI00083860A4|nr:tetratricopeptide repeat protein [Candidatus Protochlamydia phocaeensis]